MQGSYDRAKACELIGLFLLSKLSQLNINVGLFRDDGLGVSTLTKRQNDGLKKQICEIFRKNDLKITVEVNSKVVDFLDITLELDSDVYKPFLKPNNTLLYVHKDSNHPPGIIKNIPASINRRISSLSKDEEVFRNSIAPYEKALQDSGYNYVGTYAPPPPPSGARNRKRNITWYNPLFCKSLKTNLGKEFFKILHQCFPKEHKLSKIINKNTIKLSFSCMPSFGKILDSHNKKILSTHQATTPCTCRGNVCPIDGKCEEKGVIYQCPVKELVSGSMQTYVGLTERSFKDRYTKHKKSFRTRGYQRSTLSTHVWYLKDRDIDFEMSWKIIDKAKPYSPSTKICNLCIREVFFIMYHKDKATLNKRSEFFGHCLHKRKYFIENQ